MNEPGKPAFLSWLRKIPEDRRYFAEPKTYSCSTNLVVYFEKMAAEVVANSLFVIMRHSSLTPFSFRCRPRSPVQKFGGGYAPTSSH